MPVGKEEIRNRFGYHPPKSEIEVKSHEQVREAFIAFNEFLDMILPDGREKSTAFTKLQESSHWANTAIAMLSPVVEPVRPETVIPAPAAPPYEEPIE